MQVKELLALGRLFGRRCLQAKWAFLAILPEIDKRQAFRKEGSTSITEYAAKGGVSHRDVMEVLLLYRKIGQYWALWRLLAMGAVGLSKLQRISPWVSDENAAWWAEQLVKCTRAQLDGLIARLRALKAAEQTGIPVQDAPGCKILIEASVESPGLSSLMGPVTSPESVEHVGPQEESGVVGIKIFMSRYGSKALHDLHELVELAEGPISLGKLIERLVTDALGRASVSGGGSGSAGDPRDPDQSSRASGDQKPGGAGLPVRRLMQVVYRNLDTGASWIPSADGPLPLESAPPAERERIEEAPPVYFGELRARAIAAKIRHARSIAAKTKAGEPLASDDGRHIPVAIEVYLVARSGGFCEIKRCPRRVEHIHHCDAYAEHHVHDPDRMLAICSKCHDEIHGELVVPDKADPRVLIPVVPGSSVERSRVGEAVLAVKAAV
ncbi:MAG: HNH endonuclease [Candidatus Sericytochromatia bacterium]|uniref:HNH endonuclease n=1 Tax=Candidatus Tanganyikabacteria bacterium TaxID=2961651 RepID=A0A937X051_9BACT|nr:HNH endonuclease [Candidatus Tanganyikabacteria bacterium]